MPEQSLHLMDEAALAGFATAWAPVLREVLQERSSHDAAVMSLRGELGAGKSTLVRALLRALGVEGAVPSPTYTLIESYVTTGLRIAHADLYRLGDPDELDFLGFDEVLAEHDLVCVEWPDKAGDRLPDASIDVRLEYTDGDGRQLFLRGELAPARSATSL